MYFRDRILWDGADTDHILDAVTVRFSRVHSASIARVFDTVFPRPDVAMISSGSPMDNILNSKF